VGLLAAAAMSGAGVGLRARQAPQPAGQVLVFAAASLQTALEALPAAARTATGAELRMS